jgi:hypothetical protein
MFKFVSKGDTHDNESALFYNGQRILSIYATVYPDGEVMIQVEDGAQHLMTEWEDYLETTD